MTSFFVDRFTERLTIGFSTLLSLQLAIVLLLFYSGNRVFFRIYDPIQCSSFYNLIVSINSLLKNIHTYTYIWDDFFLYLIVICPYNQMITMKFLQRPTNFLCYTCVKVCRRIIIIETNVYIYFILSHIILIKLVVI